LQSCSPTGPIPTRDVELSVSDVSCTEAWLNLSVNNLTSNTQVQLLRNSSVINTFNITSSDTTLYDDSLSPNKTYNYQAVEIQNRRVISKSKIITAKTMDTTSHNWIFKTFLLGGAQNSVLNDIAIIDDTLAYAVGEIYAYDSKGNINQTPFCLARWNGTKWDLSQLKFFPPGSIGDSINAVGTSIFVVNPKDIWLTAGAVFHFNGNSWTPFYNTLGAEGAIKIWRDSKGDILFIGRNGLIISYSNGIWRKIESGTSIKLLDIWGNESDTWICGWDNFEPTILLKYEDNSLNTVLNIPNNNLNYYSPDVISGAIESIWTNNLNNLFLLTWYGLYRIKNNNFNNPKILWNGNPNTWGLSKVRGNNVNDIVGVGIYGRIWHYNGITWFNYKSLINNSYNLKSVAIKGNLMIAVGDQYENGINNYALVQVGQR